MNKFSKAADHEKLVPKVTSVILTDLQQFE